MHLVEDDDQLVHVLDHLARAVRRLASAGDLGPLAAGTLSRLAREGPQRLTVLAAGEGVSQPGMTQLVTRLEHEGLVQRGSSPEDGRVVLVEITAAGREVVGRRRVERSTALRELLDELAPRERLAIEDALPALGHLAELALPDPSPRPTVGSPA